MISKAVQRVWNVPPLSRIELDKDKDPVFIIDGERWHVPEILQIPALKDLLKYLTVRAPEWGALDKCELQHEFVGSLYFRTITIPAKTFAVGKVHKTTHSNILLRGSMEMYMNDGSPPHKVEEKTMFTADAGIRKSVYAYTECEFMNVFSLPEQVNGSTKLAEVLLVEGEDI